MVKIVWSFLCYTNSSIIRQEAFEYFQISIIVIQLNMKYKEGHCQYKDVIVIVIVMVVK